MAAMNPITRIRKVVLDMTQAQFAVAAGVSQPTVSRWETGELSPSLDEMRCIRELAQARGIGWDDSWLFEAA